MAFKLVREESPMEFFKEQLERAMEHQKVSTSAFTEHYLVSLLAGCVRGGGLPAPDPGYDETPLAVLYVQALRASRHERVRLLRAMGWETANIHLGTKTARSAILRHLKKQKAKWLHTAAEQMLDAVREDWKVWKKEGYP